MLRLPSPVRALEHEGCGLSEARLEVSELTTQNILLSLVRADLLLKFDDQVFELDVVLLELPQIFPFALTPAAWTLSARHKDQFLSFLFDSIFLWRPLARAIRERSLVGFHFRD
jgi:hypothetical protein